MNESDKSDMSDRSDKRPLIEARDLTKKYEIEKTTIDVLRGVSLSINAGETVSIIGASGAGKSTLLHTLGALDRPTTGSVLYKGEDLYLAAERRRTELRALWMFPREVQALDRLSVRGQKREERAGRLADDPLLKVEGLRLGEPQGQAFGELGRRRGQTGLPVGAAALNNESVVIAGRLDR